MAPLEIAMGSSAWWNKDLQRGLSSVSASNEQRVVIRHLAGLDKEERKSLVCDYENGFIGRPRYDIIGEKGKYIGSLEFGQAKDDGLWYSIETGSGLDGEIESNKADGTYKEKEAGFRKKWSVEKSIGKIDKFVGTINSDGSGNGLLQSTALVTGEAGANISLTREAPSIGVGSSAMLFKYGFKAQHWGKPNFNADNSINLPVTTGELSIGAGLEMELALSKGKFGLAASFPIGAGIQVSSELRQIDIPSKEADEQASDIPEIESSTKLGTPNPPKIKIRGPSSIAMKDNDELINDSENSPQSISSQLNQAGIPQGDGWIDDNDGVGSSDDVDNDDFGSAGGKSLVNDTDVVGSKQTSNGGGDDWIDDTDQPDLKKSSNVVDGAEPTSGGGDTDDEAEPASGGGDTDDEAEPASGGGDTDDEAEPASGGGDTDDG